LALPRRKDYGGADVHAARITDGCERRQPTAGSDLKSATLRRISDGPIGTIDKGSRSQVATAIRGPQHRLLRPQNDLFAIDGRQHPMRLCPRAD
jgi:hypothetical protein